MGFIFEVEHARTGDRLALKLMRMHTGPLPAVIERFKREARAATRLKSEYVVRVIDADAAPELDDALYIVMELLEGTDLEHACGGVAQPPEIVVEWLRQAAHGLDKAHALGIVHRDLKPENLFFTRGEHGEPRIKILDFGVAKTLEDAPGTTQTGQLLGTPLFMSPEHARAAGDIGPAADRYALGLIAFRLLTGTDYWESSPNIAGIIAQILYQPMVPPSARGVTLGPAFDAWFARACHREPEQRFDTALELVQELSVALGVRGSWPQPLFEQHSLPHPTALAVAAIPAIPDEAPRGSGTSIAPTLSSATRDLPPGKKRTRRTRGLLLSVFVVLAALAAWGTRSGESPPSPDSPAGMGARAEPAGHGAASSPGLPSPSRVLPAPPDVEPVAPPRAAAAEPAAALLPPARGARAPKSAKTPATLAPSATSAAHSPRRPAAKAGYDDPLADQK